MLLDDKTICGVLISSLKPSSGKRIKYQCDKCEKHGETTYQSYNKGQRRQNNSGETFCQPCASYLNNWNGGIQWTEDGYKNIRVSKGKYKREHRLIVEQSIKRKLKKEEIVHHIDGNKSNNRLDNLALCENKSIHQKAHHSLEMIGLKLYKAGLVEYDLESHTYVAHQKLRELRQEANINTGLVWMAGLIDGEGCIYARTTNKTKNLYIQVQIHAASKIMIDELAIICDKEQIDYLREGPKWQKMSTRPTHRITIGKLKHVQKLLTKLEPLLRVKKAEAKLALDFLNLYIGVSIKQKPSIEERELFIAKLKALKRDTTLALEHPEGDNQQPSLERELSEGSTTSPYYVSDIMKGHERGALIILGPEHRPFSGVDIRELILSDDIV
jgi:hypothetical protein